MAFAAQPIETDKRFRLPGWLVFVIFVPLQVWVTVHLFQEWGFWGTFLFLLVLGMLGNRAARAAWLTTLIFPGRAYRHETRRHIFQGVLFLAAAVAWFLPRSGVEVAWDDGWPQPWLPLAFAVTLLKATLR